MAAQAALIADTIAGMKRALSGNQYSSDSDDSFDYPSNRGNKLKRKAQYVHEGQLDRPNGPKVYKRKIEHAGYERYIISHNPKRYDEDGDELDDDEVDEQADVDAAARNPYHEIRLEELLAPLTSAADLPNHPSMSVPYLSNTLTSMVQQACEMMHREKKTLWNVKHLLTKLRGDETWIPCGDLNSEVDDMIFDTESVYNEIVKSRPRTGSNGNAEQILANGDGSPRAFNQRGSKSPAGALTVKVSANGILRGSEEKSHAVVGDDTKVGPLDSSGVAVKSPSDASEAIQAGKPNSTVSARQDENAEVPRVVSSPVVRGRMGNEDASVDGVKSLQLGHDAAIMAANSTNLDTNQNDLKVADNSLEEPVSNQDQLESRANDLAIESAGKVANVQTNQDVALDVKEGKEKGSTGGADGDDVSQPIPHRMTTRAQAQAASEKSTSSRTRSASPASWNPPVIHPLFLMPPSAHPDHDFGLPPSEAEETRRVVTLYVQKQEEVCRGAEKLYIGLLRADRMRKDVFKWCKAEGHVGEMSDGEDWYDKEEWGLDEDLRKGHEDEEDDTVIQGKKKVKRT